MILYPAIDIRGGRAVRLERGDYARETVYDSDPADAARRWVGQGARWLHVVDLDGARSGVPENLGQVERIVATAGVEIQLGGGLRDAEAVDAALSAGAGRVVLGTAALAEPGLVAALAAEHGERVLVGVDARSGQVAVEGWERETRATPVELVAELTERGVRGFVYTPVEVDGTMRGPGLEGLGSVAAATAAAGARLIYSGGVGSLDDLRAIRALGLDGLDGAIVGRALYEGRFTVAEGQAALDG
ncbi:MAG TPA: 1-(5-phosphoribosyl)-5-[(5-phosphoribosylamino)methylideneamino]imidazole-4-carboxamide isomerase [Solirubrobacterales bacterium]|nr:1-(5-phosphoribosyl)-5-[(5-phosphoribosylamino)methylideneamino]imidazole-4-carboxamide isomerase [Solirubrobacterales bacterium]